MHVYISVYGHIYPCMLHLGAQEVHKKDTLTAHSHPGSWCTLYQADLAMVQHHLTFMWRAVVLAQLPFHAVTQLNKHIYK